MAPESDEAQSRSKAIAIVGMACVFPGAHTPEELWRNVLAGRRELRRTPDQRLPLRDYYDPGDTVRGKTCCDQLAVITGWSFDPLEFSIPPVTAEATDTTHWLALWTAREAFRDAGLDLETLDKSRIAVILGNSLGGEFGRTFYLRLRQPYAERALERAIDHLGTLEPEMRDDLLRRFRHYYSHSLPPITEDSLAGTMSNTISGRICNAYDLGGGGHTVDGACSSSLLAMAQSCELLTRGDADVVLTGGVDISLDPYELVGFSETQALARHDIRPYDRNAEGMIPGEGCGLVVLMRAAEAIRRGHHVRSLIRGWGHSSDGMSGITAPRQEGQLRAMRRAYRKAGYPLSSVGLIEGHGTGTVLGDQVELRSILALREEELDELDDDAIPGRGVSSQPCRIGSIKGNIGHCKAAAGAAGVIKAVMALERKIIPPTAGCTEPHPLLRRAGDGLFAALHGRPWPGDDGPRRAAVSAFGFGGANAHLTLEEADPDGHASPEDLALMNTAKTSELILVSAPDREALVDRLDHVRSLAAHISRSELTDLAADLLGRDKGESHRVAIATTSPRHLARMLDRVVENLVDERDPTPAGDGEGELFAGVVRPDALPPRLVMVFPGQGTQSVGMSRHLLSYSSEVGRWCSEFDEAVRDLLPGGLTPWLLADVREVDEVLGRRWSEAIAATEIAQPLIIAASLLALKVLGRLGLRPDIVLGHSLGMVAALAAKKAFRTDVAVRIAALRGRAIADLGLIDPGGMLALAADAEETARLVDEVGGGLTLANYNTPRQTTVSGGSEAISALASICERHGVTCRRLSVSHAFHSNLVAPAAEAFHDELKTMEMSPPDEVVVSTLSGDLLDPDADLPGLLADHLRLPVRFHQALGAAAALRPALWVDVSSGGVISGLARETLGEGLLCCSTEGSAQLDALLGQAYVLGFPLDRSQLFATRFHRPFPFDGASPALLVNPCERPVPPPDDRPKAAEPEVDDRPEPETANSPADERAATLRFAMDWIARRTGFPREQIDPRLRLRSDLNMDSIKATELVQALVAKNDTDLRPAPGFENAPIAEVVDVVLALRDQSSAEGGADGLVRIGTRLGDDGAGSDWVRTFAMSDVEAPLGRETRLPPMQPLSVAVVARRESNRVWAVTDALRAAGLVPLRITPSRLIELSRGATELGALVWIESSPAEMDRALINQATELLATARWTLGSPSKESRPLRWLVARSDPCPEMLSPLDAGAAFLKSLCHEFRELSAKWLRLPDIWSPQRWGEAVTAELLHGGRRVLYAYRPDGRRMCDAARLVESRERAGREPGLGSDDVVLVTGGARGITSLLARALAEETGARLVLIGSSPADSPQIRAILAEWLEAGHQVRYHGCDVRDLKALRDMVATVTVEMGAVTGILHGAGVTEPTPLAELGDESFWRCIDVKARGLRNLLAACPPSTLKMLHVLSSVIGSTGMALQPDYAFANAWIEGSVSDLSSSHPRLHAVSLAYTLWRDTGMGRNIDAVDALGKLGITALPDEAGVESYRAVLRGEVPAGRLICTGRLAPNLELSLHLPPPEDRPPFLETPRRWIPGVELIAETTLSLEADPYLRDHLVNGTPILPAVVGIEAMVSAAMACTGRSDLPVLRDLRFKRAIVVPEDATHRIQVLARVLTEPSTASEEHPPEVRVAIRSQSDGFTEDAFYGLCRFGAPSAPLSFHDVGAPPDRPLVPAEQFAPDLLFQGPAFQSLRGFWDMQPGLSTLAALRVPRAATSLRRGTASHQMTPSLALSDGTLQAALPLIGRPAVAMTMEELRFLDNPPPGTDVIARTHLVSVEAMRTHVDIATDAADGTPVLRLRGAVFEPIQRRPHAIPASYDELAQALAARWRGTRFAMASVRHDAPEDTPSDAPRRRVGQANLCALRRALAEFSGLLGLAEPDPETVTLGHAPDGKPKLVFGARQPEGLGAPDVSLTDMDGLSIAVVGDPFLGVDIEPIERRKDELWGGLLGVDGYALALRIMSASSENLSAAATRAWTVFEALAKATGTRPALERCRLEVDGPWLRVTPPAREWQCLNVRLRARPDGSLPAAAFTLVSIDPKPEEGA